MVERAAAQLREAEQGREPIAPLVDSFPELSLDDSYAIQASLLATRLEEGAKLIGRKVGLTSAAMQRQMGVDRPDYGFLVDDMICPEGQVVPAGRFLQPRVEPEVAFVLGEDLRGPGVTVAEAAKAVALVLPAIEIIDSRIADWRISIRDTIADNASSGGLVLGTSARELPGLDLRLMGCNLYRNGLLVGSGAGGAALGSPVSSLAWLANTLAVHDVGLTAGDVILPGSVTASVAVVPGDSVTAFFAGLGSVSVTFGGEAT